MSETDVAPWCYKWKDGWVGWIGYGNLYAKSTYGANNFHYPVLVGGTLCQNIAQSFLSLSQQHPRQMMPGKSVVKNVF